MTVKNERQAERLAKIVATLEERFTDGRGRAVVETWINEACQYRTPDGNACAVGVLLSDNWYREHNFEYNYEGTGVEGIPLPKSLYPFVNLLSWAQGIHDDASNWTKTTGKLNAEALKHFRSVTSKLIESTRVNGLDAALNEVGLGVCR